MNGPGHYALGASAGLVWCQVGHVEAWQVPIVLAVSAGFSSAALSPDIDGTKLWHIADRILPDELLGEHGPMRHRGVTHWWGLHLALTWALYVFHPSWWWFGGAVLAGWWSHLAGDFAVGARGQGRGPGIPLFPWWGHVGLGAKCGGWTEAVLAVLIPLVTVPWVAAWHVTGTPQPWTLVA